MMDDCCGSVMFNNEQWEAAEAQYALLDSMLQAEVGEAVDSNPADYAFADEFSALVEERLKSSYCSAVPSLQRSRRAIEGQLKSSSCNTDVYGNCWFGCW